MKFATLALVATSVASAGPVLKRADGPTDEQILNYALTLEHLEDAFYSGALAKYDESAFTQAGLPSWARGRFAQVGAHEASHVATLAGALGNAATKPCNYSFPYTDPASFAALSSVLEGVGVSAYLGAAQYISSPAYLTVAGSILTTESRHQAWVTSAARKHQAWSGPYDTPLGLSQIYTLAAGFITSCPSSNPKLPVQAFPALTVNPATAAAGDDVTYNFNVTSSNGGNSSSSSTTYYAVIYHGLNQTALKLDSSKKATLPEGLQGTYYTVISTSASNVSDSNTVAGPLISIDNFLSSASNP